MEGRFQNQAEDSRPRAEISAESFPEISNFAPEKIALLFERQSTVSARAKMVQHQALIETAHRLGWADNRIETIGCIGSSPSEEVHDAHARLGQRVVAGGVGAVFLSDLTRYSRLDTEVSELQEMCRQHLVRLVCADDGGWTESLHPHSA